MDDEAMTTILDLLDTHDTLVLATIRNDGSPHTSQMNYVHKGPTIYFWADSKTRKAQYLKRNARVSATLCSDSSNWLKVRGLNLDGVARRTTVRSELDLAMTLSLAKYPQMVKLVAEDFQEPLCYRIEATSFTILDYTQKFGHTRHVAMPDARRGRGLRIVRSA